MMNVRFLNRSEAEKAMGDWLANYPQQPEISGEYAVIRNDLTLIYQSVRRKSEDENVKSKEYFIDANFGMQLYCYLKKQDWFSVRLAADDGFWRYMSLKVIPGVVGERWKKDNEDHYWSKTNRIWLKQIWWYIYLSWKKDEETTKRIIDSPNCSTDTILNFVERTGQSKGTCVDAYRWIAYFNSIIPAEVVSAYNKKLKNKNDTLFRIIMRLNTAKMFVVEPVLCIDGYEGYARKLFIDAGIAPEYLNY